MSRQGRSLHAETVIATAIVAAHRFATLAGAQSSAGGDALGVSQYAVAVGEPLAVDVIGTAVVETGGAFALGAAVGPGANGVAVAVTGSSTKQATIAGGAAGALTVTGIKATDRLVSVIVLDRDATAANITLANLTAEFSVSAADTITNAGGTATTGNALLVTWETASPIRAKALQASTGTGQFVEVLLLPSI